MTFISLHVECDSDLQPDTVFSLMEEQTAFEIWRSVEIIGSIWFVKLQQLLF